MKVWKVVVVASMLFSTIFSALIYRNMSIRGRTITPSSSEEHQPQDPRLPPSPQSYKVKYKSIFKTHTDEEAKELVRTLIQRYRRSPDSKRKARTHSRMTLRSKRAKSRATSGCTMKEINVTVSDLGFAHVSEEVVRFRYCAGSCDAEEKNYDLTLKALRNSKRIKKEKVRARPCCRPTLYDDDVSFLDDNFRYYTLRQLSAKECGCV
ncbi:neurturin-like [Scyliorhinus canicula]|uniref:neurturin-like n=1 Tax=Scyliorhinus canicula TaxID=7830 RepID=UPI0018F474DB|nr:neurturin-like [Scyliorhinus canicula]XP_038633767.1 neurturin-like [Scyliorhinus canicula]